MTACDNYTWSAPLGNGNIYTASGTFTHVSTNAVPAHLNRGDKLGTCASAPCGSMSLMAAPSNNASIALQHKGEEMKMLLYPNPAQNVVNLTLENTIDGEATLQSLDITGKVFSHTKQTFVEGANVLTLDIAGFPNGLYYVKVQTVDNQIMVQKLQIIH